MVKNILLETAYDGAGFFGYQIQKNQRTVEEELKKAVNNLTCENNRLISCGRTDGRVHAKSHFVNFLTASSINPRAFCFHLQALLPDDILALSSREVPLDFHARFSCKDKTYKYVINTERNMHPIHRNYMTNITYKLDFELLAKGLDLLKGEHDFRLFMKDDSNAEINTVREIFDAYYEKDDKYIYLYFRAHSFLHNQVRIMVGTLVELARGKLSLDNFKKFVDSEADKRANPALGPQGLYLWRVDY